VIPLRGLNRPVTSQQLDIPQTAAGAMDIASRRSDEAAAARMRRTAVDIELDEQTDKPVDDAVGAHRTAARGTYDRAIPFTLAFERLQRVGQVGVNGDPPAAVFLGDRRILVYRV
jgi:hypothetical protein